ncbi:unnamed protein product [Lactuca saligna]|uniref:non-specific serine/threonine protein kinase n=1 Tax=Lactuca saligna TaxID=75948 RepID=A0AA35Y6F0_LACSI|nr:unnamed protein product [Lactuca saligna]
MSSSGVNLEKYQIPLEEIIRATNNFSSESKIGDGGFGMVYIGQLSKHWHKAKVAIKRLDHNGYQGSNEFHNELKMVSSFNHPNIVPFIGYCDDENEMIIVYEYAINGSLDRLLEDPNKWRYVTWAQRMRICLGAARGLKYLHSGLGENRRVIHRDVKSANILLDEHLQAKISDFGLSRFGPRNQPHSQLITKASGTRFYIDPLYNERGRLSKESDVYSFGVVLFEMSSGMLAYRTKCFGDGKEQYLLDLVRSYYDDEEVHGLDKLIDPIMRDDINMRSFHTFNGIAHECVNLDSKKRPTMERIIREIEKASDIQLPHIHSPPAANMVGGIIMPLIIEDLPGVSVPQEHNSVSDDVVALAPVGYKVNNRLRFPALLKEFLNPIKVSAEEFFSEWRLLARPPLKLQEVVKGVNLMSLEEMTKLFHSLRLMVCPGLDPNANNLVASTDFYSKDIGAMLCLVRIETDPADRTQLRMTVASRNPTLTFQLKEFIKKYVDTNVKPIRDIAEGFYALCLKDIGVLYEDPYIQIGIKAEWQKHYGRIVLFIGNKNASAPLESVHVVILPLPHLKLELSLVPETIAPRAQVQCPLEVINLNPSCDVAVLDFSYKFQKKLVINRLRLPIVLNKFLNPIQVSVENFFSQWRSLAGPPLKLQQVVRGVRPISLKEMENLFNSLRLMVCQGLDTSVNNIVASTTFYSQSTGAMLCLVRIETDPADRTQIRMTVASRNPTLTFELKEDHQGTFS